MVLVGILWFTEALPLTFTSLLIPVLAILMGVSDTGPILSHFAHPIIFLFLGGFALAAALSKYQLDTRIGDLITRQAKTRPIFACYAMFVMTAFLSMWISNTATAAMMLPIALGIAMRFGQYNHSAKLFLLLGMAYSANIGGIATLIGSPPNAIAAASYNLSFMDWLKIGLPVSIVLFIAMIWLLKNLIRPDLKLSPTNPDHSPEAEHEGLSWPHYKVILIFSGTVAAWILSQPLSKLLGINSSGFDTLVALSAIAVLGFSGSLSWKELERNTNWGILLLFGGGLALSHILSSTGTSAFIAQGIQFLLAEQPIFITLLLITTCVIFLTEMVSNTASAALLIPLLTSVASSLGISEVTIAMLIAISASCAFMLPVATPPNAIVYGSGFVPQKQMIKNGFWLNICCIVIISAVSVWLV